MSGYIEIVTNFLNDRAIAYSLVRHPAVVSVEDSKKIIHIENCLGCKSLFVKDKKSAAYYMAVLPCDKRAQMRGLAEQVGHSKFEFASAEDMFDFLGVVRGNVSPFCYIIKNALSVTLLLDKEVLQAQRVRFHPCDNTATVVLDTADFLRTLEILGVKVVLVD